MSESLSSVKQRSWDPNHWVTAKVVDTHRAHRYICRLDTLGYDFQVVSENRQLRILVRKRALEEVLDWLGDLQPCLPPKPRSIDTRASVVVLVALPTGVLLGNLFCRFVGVADQFASSISGYCGLAFAALAYIIFVSRIKR